MATTRKAAVPAVREDRDLAAVQASLVDSEAKNQKVATGQVVDDDSNKKYDYLKLRDRQFRLAENLNTLALMKWGASAELDTADPRALGAIYVMLKSLVLADDWSAFEAYALDLNPDADELFDFLSKALEVVGGRPTKQS